MRVRPLCIHPSNRLMPRTSQISVYEPIALPTKTHPPQTPFNSGTKDTFGFDTGRKPHPKSKRIKKATFEGRFS